MTALAHQDTIRESRVYRVNAWREYKGRPAIDFDAPKQVLRLVEDDDEVLASSTKGYKPHPPEWWTAENTAAWQRQVWGGEVDASEGQRTWGRKLQHGDHIAHGRFPPPTAKQYREWEAIYTQKGR